MFGEEVLEVVSLRGEGGAGDLVVFLRLVGHVDSETAVTGFTGVPGVIVGSAKM